MLRVREIKHLRVHVLYLVPVPYAEPPEVPARRSGVEPLAFRIDHREYAVICIKGVVAYLPNRDIASAVCNPCRDRRLGVQYRVLAVHADIYRCLWNPAVRLGTVPRIPVRVQFLHHPADTVLRTADLYYRVGKVHPGNGQFFDRRNHQHPF